MWILINNKPVRIADIQFVDYGTDPWGSIPGSGWRVHINVKEGEDYRVTYGEEVFKTEKEAIDKRDEILTQLNQLFNSLPRIKF